MGAGEMALPSQSRPEGKEDRTWDPRTTWPHHSEAAWSGAIHSALPHLHFLTRNTALLLRSANALQIWLQSQKTPRNRTEIWKGQSRPSRWASRFSRSGCCVRRPVHNVSLEKEGDNVRAACGNSRSRRASSESPSPCPWGVLHVPHQSDCLFELRTQEQVSESD